MTVQGILRRNCERQYQAGRKRLETAVCGRCGKEFWAHREQHCKWCQEALCFGCWEDSADCGKCGSSG